MFSKFRLERPSVLIPGHSNTASLLLAASRNVGMNPNKQRCPQKCMDGHQEWRQLPAPPLPLQPSLMLQVLAFTMLIAAAAAAAAAMIAVPQRCEIGLRSG